MFGTVSKPYREGAVSLIAGVAAAVLVAIIFGTLYLGRDVFVPIALAIWPVTGRSRRRSEHRRRQ
jgi:hypothetical protein